MSPQERQLRQLLGQPAYRRLAKQVIDHARRMEIAVEDACYPPAVRVSADATPAELRYADRMLIQARLEREYAAAAGRVTVGGVERTPGTGRLYYGAATA